MSHFKFYSAPHLGAGGGTQYFIEDSDKKNLTSTGKIIKYGK